MCTQLTLQLRCSRVEHLTPGGISGRPWLYWATPRWKCMNEKQEVAENKFHFLFYFIGRSNKKNC